MNVNRIYAAQADSPADIADAAVSIRMRKKNPEIAPGLRQPRAVRGKQFELIRRTAYDDWGRSRERHVPYKGKKGTTASERLGLIPDD